MPGFRGSRHITPRGSGRFAVKSFLDSGNSLDFKVRTNIEWDIAEMITSAPSRTEIDVWMFGPGGSLHEAYRLWRALRERCCWLRSIVISHAKSALTMLALGGDEIWMGSSAALSPLDGQVTRPEQNDQISGIDFSNALELGREEAIQYLRKLIAAFPKDTFTLKHVLDLSAALFGQLLEKTDLPRTSTIKRSMEIPVHYLTEMLAARACPKRRGFNAAKVARHLVYKYASHDHAISRDHARKLGLPVYDLKSYPYFDALQQEHREWLEDGEPGVPLIEVVKLSS